MESRDNLEQEINDLEIKIKEGKKNNKVRNLKIYKNVMQRIAPYVLIGAGITGAFKLSGNTPFVRDNQKQYYTTITTRDTLGNYIEEKSFEDHSKDKNAITYYGKWQTTEDGNYSRLVKIYYLEDTISGNIIDNFENCDIAKLKHLIEKPNVQYNEIETFVSDDELNENDYYILKTYYNDKENYILVKEDIKTNDSNTFLFIFVLIFSEVVMGASDWILLETQVKDKNLLESIGEIKDIYPYIDVEILNREKMKKEEEYKRLIRKIK